MITFPPSSRSCPITGCVERFIQTYLLISLTLMTPWYQPTIGLPLHIDILWWVQSLIPLIWLDQVVILRMGCTLVHRTERGLFLDQRWYVVVLVHHLMCPLLLHGISQFMWLYVVDHDLGWSLLVLPDQSVNDPLIPTIIAWLHHELLLLLIKDIKMVSDELILLML